MMSRMNLRADGTTCHASAAQQSKRVSPNRRGFTLVELLVVIAIIGILVGLAIPAVNMVRVRAQTASCANNLRQIGMAITAFETEKQRYPAAIYNPLSSNPNTTFTWVVPLLPALDGNVLYDNLQNEVSTGNDAMAVWTTDNVQVGRAKQAYFRILNCPSDPNKIFEGPELSYTVNMGTADGSVDPNRLDFPALGIFHNRTDFAKANNLDVSFDRDGLKDGESYTLLVSENANAWAWGPTRDNPDTGSLDESNFYRQLYEISHGLIFVNAQQPPTVSINFGNCANLYGNNFSPWEEKPADIDCWNGGTIQDKLLFSRPSSYHPQGFNAVFGGNEVRYISNTIDYSVYARMMTPDGISLDPNLWPYAKGGLSDAEIE